jgi:hypothetical protein
MSYKTKCDIVEEKLEWDYFILPKATKLFIGTFPTVLHRRSFEFFYPILTKMKTIKGYKVHKDGLCKYPVRRISSLTGHCIDNNLISKINLIFRVFPIAYPK